MHTGQLIDQLIEAVERVEEHAHTEAPANGPVVFYEVAPRQNVLAGVA